MTEPFSPIIPWLVWIIPMVVLSIRELISNKLFRQASRIFLILLVIIFTIAISLTSMETRHLGNFLISFIVLATIVDVRTEANRVSLKLMNTQLK